MLQENFDKIAFFEKSKIIQKSYCMELYFDTEDFDGFLERLEKHPEVEKLHEAETFPWHQRGIRIFDPDGNIIEVSEDMYVVASRFFDEGKSVGEVSELTQHPLDEVEKWHEKYNEKFMSVCGTDCGKCEFWGSMCKGCNELCGKVFHSPGGCAIYLCCREKRGLKSCGKCGDFPCNVWQKTRAPSYSDEEFKKSMEERVRNLKDL